MRVSIHQPNYLPWLGLFYKVYLSDCFVILDDAQYTKNGLINRNRVKGPNGASWLTVPVKSKGAFGTSIRDSEIANDTAWSQKHLRTLDQDYSKSRCHGEVLAAVEEVLSRRHDNLCALNVELLSLVMDRAGLEKKTVMASELGVSSTGTQRLIDICARLGAETYVSGSGGRNYQDEELFARAGVSVVYSDFVPREYGQLWGPFEPKLSAIDYIFNHGWDLGAFFKEAN